jgi:Cu-Zn family superoxide dismutase
MELDMRLIMPFLFLSLSATAAFAQSEIKSARADIINVRGVKIGTANFSPSALGIRVAVNVEHLEPGEHGIHIHNVGKCDKPDFTTAGTHFNPTDAHHGINNPQEPHPHLGDMANLIADKKGRASANFVLPLATLADGPNSLFHDGATSIVIHAKADDLMSDPSGNSGDRIACGIIQKPE